eukprot:PITA_11923
MVEEYDSIVRNSVWDVVLRPEDESMVSSRWLYKIKQATDGSVEKHKTRFVAYGFSQVEGIDYDETFAPIARIEEEVYIEQPEVFDTFDRESHVCRLKRALYGLNLAREFEMKDMGFMHYFLGMEVWEGDGELFVSQGKYANEILRRFRMEISKPMETPLAGN